MPWSFYELGVENLDPFLLKSGQLKFVIVRVDYLAKVVSKITTKRSDIFIAATHVHV